MKRIGLQLWLITIIGGLALAAAACDGGTVAPAAPVVGDTLFTSAPPDYGGWGYGFEDDANTRGEAGVPSGDQGGQATPEREIEEADIVKVVGTTLYALNMYRGLYVIDIANPDAPAIRGHLDTFGYPVEMYVRDDRAYLVLSNYFRIWRDPANPYAEIGSAVVAVDVSNGDSPVELSRFYLPGYVTDTRVVGDVLYGVSNRYSWFSYYYPSDDWQDTTHVLSINIADPFDIHEVDALAFPRDGGWDNHVHVTSQAIYVATTYYGDDGYQTQLRYVNISDPAGALSIGAEWTVEGIVQDRWQMDEHNGVFRLVTPDNWWNNSQPKVHTYRVYSPTQIVKLAEMELQLPRPESLTAVRFDGDRAYIVTYERVDPLFVVDLSDPTAPVQAGELEMPGWLDHIVPRGDRLIALGHDDSGGDTVLAVSLFDVSDAYNPTLLARVEAGEGWGWLTDERDNYDKVFKVLDNEGLILLPFMQCGTDGYWRCTGGVQLVDFTSTTLTKRATVAHEGYIRRALLAGGRLMTLSDQRLQVLDITDRDHPAKTADLTLSRNVTQLAAIGDYGIQLVGDWYSGETKIVIVPMGNPDLGAEVAELEIDAPYARLFTNGNHVYVLHRDRESYEKLYLTPIDLSDPAAPVKRAALELPEGVFDYYGYYYGWWMWGYWGYPRMDEVVQVNGSTLVFHAVRSWAWCNDCEADRLIVVDLSTPDVPVIAAGDEGDELRLDNRDWVAGLKVVDGRLYFTHYNVLNFTDLDGRPMVRYYINHVDVSDPYAPVIGAPINVPGVLLGADHGRGEIYTVDYQYQH
ncbi:MAG: beta-propeller domain-containing protein, partial [bacterium]